MWAFTWQRAYRRAIKERDTARKLSDQNLKLYEMVCVKYNKAACEQGNTQGALYRVEAQRDVQVIEINELWSLIDNLRRGTE